MVARAIVAFVAVPGLVAFGVPGFLAYRAGPPAGLRLLGIVPVVLGTAGLLLCVRDFCRTGRGTLATWDPPEHLVTVGLYRHTRNPMYVSVLLVLLGWTALSASFVLLGYTVLVGIAFHLHAVYREEPWQARMFGEAWRAYRARVPRWFGRRVV